ncbi:hypothetical protein SK128_005789 [Halocaridina rubra]|uniref:Uncharacterized protein n=1 Tax=Halocaridina rubra TaxID=373956 RepID=A0AAN9A5G6_HALRR
MLSDASQDPKEYDNSQSTNTWHNGLDRNFGGGNGGSRVRGMATMSRCPEVVFGTESAASAPCARAALPSCSLTLSRNSIGAGPNECFTIRWKLVDDIAYPSDWLGLYVVGENDPDKCLEQHDVSGDTEGEICWSVNVPAVLPKNVGSIIVRYHRGKENGRVCLGSSAVVRVVRLSDGSTSDSSEDETLHPSLNPQRCLTCTRLLHFTLSNLSAHGLRRGMFFQPDPYVKLRILPGETQTLLPHHGQESRSCVAENTVNPTWKRQEFSFVAYLHDILEIELKDKFAKSRPIISRFLGRLTIQVATLKERVKSGSAGTIDFPLNSKNAADSVTGHMYFNVAFSVPANASEPCTSHGGLECPGDMSVTLNNASQSLSKALLSPHSEQEPLANGFMENKKHHVRTSDNSNPTVNNWIVQGCREEEVIVNGEVVPSDIKSSSDNSEGRTNASSRESDYSPIWKYSCKVPTNIASNMNINEIRGSGEEAIYETVYPAEDYQNQDLDSSVSGINSVASDASVGRFNCDASQPFSDEDSPPPLPPRTKSLMKSYVDSVHRPLERSMAVQLGLPPPFPTVVRKHPCPLPCSSGNATGHSSSKVPGVNSSPAKSLNGTYEPSVRPKSGHLSASSQSSFDSESSTTSTGGEPKKLPCSVEGSFSYDIVDLDDVLQISELSLNQIDIDSQLQGTVSSSQGLHSSLQSSSCASMESEPSEDMTRPCSIQSNIDETLPLDRCTGEVSSQEEGAVGGSSVAPLATPEQDTSLLQETTSTDTLLENLGEVSDYNVNLLFSKGGHAAACTNVNNDSSFGICDTGASCGSSSFKPYGSSLTDCKRNQSDAVSSLNVKNEYVLTTQEKLGEGHGINCVTSSSVQGGNSTQSFESSNTQDAFNREESQSGSACQDIRGDAACTEGVDAESVSLGLQGSREGSSARSPSPRLSDSLQVLSSASESVSPISGSVTCSVSSQGGDDGRRGSESTCMVMSTESSSSNSVFTSPTTESNDMNIEMLSSVSYSADLNIPANSSSESHAVGQGQEEGNCVCSVRPKREAILQATSSNEDDDIPPAVPPHRPQHHMLKALVHPPLCPPTPTHHAKPQPPERTTSDKRDRDVFFGREDVFERDEKQFLAHHPKLSRQPSLQDWLRRYPKVEVAFDEPLPPNVEARKDSHGRIFFIDHVAKTTSWEWPPPKPLSIIVPYSLYHKWRGDHRRSFCESAESECSGSQTSSRVGTPDSSTPASSGNLLQGVSCMSPSACDEGAVGPSPPPLPTMSPPPFASGIGITEDMSHGEVMASHISEAGAVGLPSVSDNSRWWDNNTDGDDGDKAPTPPPRPQHRLSRATPPLPPPLPEQCPPTPTHHPRRSQHPCALDQEQNGHIDRHSRTMRLPSIPERTVKFQRVEIQPGEEPLPTSKLFSG